MNILKEFNGKIVKQIESDEDTTIRISFTDGSCIDLEVQYSLDFYGEEEEFLDIDVFDENGQWSYNLKVGKGDTG